MSGKTTLLASQKRAAHPAFASTFSLSALIDRLPLRFPCPTQTPPSAKRHYRSAYRYLGHTDLADLAGLMLLTVFEIALRLIDFSALRDWLAQHYRPSARGQVPFDPISLFLCVCLRRELGIGWSKLARLLAGEHGAGWRRLFGFQDGVTPSASGLRYFFNTVGAETFEELCPLFIDLLHQAGLLPEQSTFPGDSPERGVSISHDIMLHEAQSNMRCAQVTDTCYQPAPRPCPARDDGKEGCACSEPKCAQVCHLTTPLDAEARAIYYSGRNKDADLPGTQTSHERLVYGYASNPDRLLDDRFACAWTMRTSLHPANADERKLFPDSFAELRQRFPYLNIGEMLADAALGYHVCLEPIWQAGALRMVDIRADQNDLDLHIQLQRGYDQHGHPLCLHGYPMSANGHDYLQRRTKWCCRQICHHPPDPLPDHFPPGTPPDCPNQGAEHPFGQIVNVGYALPDHTVRLAREIPYASATWKKRYGRRNLSESRNSCLEALHLKRMPNFGLPHNRREITVADFLVNLHTLARLVQEATALAYSSG
jgi:hypothetical protein